MKQAKSITIPMDTGLLKKFAIKCRENDLKMTEVIRKLIKDYLEERN